jgi:putative aldouronate transport system permease protein
MTTIALKKVLRKMTVPQLLFEIFKVAFLLFICFITLYPFLKMVAVSLSEDIYVLKNQIGIIPKGLNFETYKKVLGDSKILVAYKNTIIYVVLHTVIALAITCGGAYALSKKHMLFNRTFTLMIVFTMFFNGGMIPTYLVVQSLGLLNTIWAVVLPGAVSVWYLILMRTFFSAIPKELEESGTIDGLNDIGILWYIILPLSKASIATIGLFYAVAMWNAFFSPFLYLTTPTKFPLQVILRQIVIANEMKAGEVAGDTMILPEALKFATIMVSSLPIIMVYPFIQKYFVQGVMVGSVKG